MLTITNLKDSPELYHATLKIVEEEFLYPANEKMTTDFAPLFIESNHHNCFVLLKDKKPIGHIGLREVSFEVNEMIFPIAFIGAIAITKSEQGKGYFSFFFEEFLKLKAGYPLYFLWSENHDLYKRFDFLPAIGLNIYKQEDFNLKFSFEKKILKDLSLEDKKQILTLYNKNQAHLPYRSIEDLKVLELITSASLYLKKTENKITDYFFVSKGADLKNIIHESYFSSENSLKEALTNYTCWTTSHYEGLSFDLVASTLVCPGEINSLSQLIAHYTEGEIKLHFIKDNKAQFEFEEKLLKLSLQDFMQGIFGPNQFEELQSKGLKPFFIPGLDSI